MGKQEHKNCKPPKYKIGDKFFHLDQELTLIESCRKYDKNNHSRIWWTFRCSKCNQVSNKIEKDFGKTGCPVCHNMKTVKGYNDIATTHPWMMEYLVDKEDGYRYRASSHKKVEAMCPHCKTKKTINIDNLHRRGIGCTVCSDSLPHGEKYMVSMLNQLGVEYVREYSPTWASGKRYDFYLPTYSTIIEVHGEQHYRIHPNSKFGRNKTIEDEQENDRYKKKLAIANNIQNYVVLDNRLSLSSSLKENIISSPLFKILSVSSEEVDFNKCHIDALSNTYLRISDLYNSGIDYKDIAYAVGYHEHSVRQILKKYRDGVDNICPQLN